MTSLFENLKMKGGGDRKPGCPNDVHFKLHKTSKGRSQKHSILGMNLSTGQPCNCSFNLWCEYPALTEITGNGIAIVAKPDIINYIKNIISFVNSFNTDSIVIRLQAPKIQLDWTIQDTSRMYQALAGVGTYGGSLTGSKKERTFPFYSLEDKTDNSTIGYLINQLKVINPKIKIYLLPYVGFDAGSTGPFNFVSSSSPSTAISGYSAGTTDNQNAVDSFWCAVKFYKYYSEKCKSNVGYSFNGVIIETENSQLDTPIVPGLGSANAQIKATYSLFNTAPQSSLIGQGVLNYSTTSVPYDITSIEFGLTGSPTISKTINQINTVSIGSNKINITTLWPQYYNLGVASDPTEQLKYSSLDKLKVSDYINREVSHLPSDNDTSAEVMGMLSIETNMIRKYSSTGVVFGGRTPFFGQAGWEWDDVCYVGNNAIKNRILKNGMKIKPTIFSGADLSTDLGKANQINILINNNFITSSC